MKSNRYVWLMVLAALVLVVAACGGGAESPGTDENGETDGNGESEDQSEENADDNAEGGEAEELPAGSLEIRGSDTMVNLGQALAEAYMEHNDAAGLSVTGGGSGTGIAALINDDIDLVQASRAMKDEEISEAEENGVEPTEFVVGQDGLAVLIHDDNPVKEMTIEQIKDIFTGKTTDWSDLGWDDGGEISVYSRQSNSGTYVYFNENVMDGEDFSSGAKFMPGSSAIAEAVAQEPNAIGYIGIGYVGDGLDAVSVAQDENSDYITPFDADNVDSGTYPIARPLYFYVNGTPEGVAYDYLKWVLTSDEAKDIIYETGFYQIGQYESQNDETLNALGIEF